MGRYVALLRGINVGKGIRVPMAALRDLMVETGFSDVKTLLQSGNAVFASEGMPAAELELVLEAALVDRLGVQTDFFVRDMAAWEAVVDGNPFPDEAKVDPAHLVAILTRHAPSLDHVAELRAAIKGRELVRLAGEQVYAFYPDGIGESKLTISIIEKKLGTRGTARNWNTVLKLAEMVRD